MRLGDLGDRDGRGEILWQVEGGGPPYPWDVWIALSMYSGRFVVLTQGVDWTAKNRNGFVNTARYAAEIRQLRVRSMTAGLAVTEIGLYFYREETNRPKTAHSALQW